MRKTLTIAAFLVAAFMVAAFALAAPARAAEHSFDFGTPDDFKAENPVWLPPQPVNYWWWGNHDPKTFIRYETADRFWWVTRPRGKDADAAISARVLKHRHFGFIRSKTLDGASTVHLSIRFKDNLLDPVTIWARGKSDWVPMGKLGGANDHRWKSWTGKVRAQDITTTGGYYEFRVSNQDYGDLMGDLPVDRVRVSDADFAPEADIAGFWPTPPPSKFADLGRTQRYRAGAKPMYVVGGMIKGARKTTWKEFRDAGANHVNLQSWEFNWRRKWEVYADERFTDRVRFGFGDWNDQCADAGVTCSAQFFTDSRSYWIESQYGGEENMLRALGEVVKFHKGTPANLVWYPKDEADHDDPTWGAPPEFVLQMTDVIRRNDPDTPVLLLFQGWKPRVYEIYRDGMDVAAFDVYPLGASPPRSVTEIADRVDDMRRQLGDSKALWAVVEAHDGEHVRESGRQLSAEQTSVQGWLALAHGAQGVIFFMDNEGRYLDATDMPGPWKGMSRFATEITNPKDGIESFLVPPARIVDIMGERGESRVWKPELHTTLRRRADGQTALIVVNTSPDPVPNARMWVKGLKEGTRVEVRFEKRGLAAEDEVIVDSIDGYGRRVYIFPGPGA